MDTFVNSLESACEHSNAVAKHHDLFRVFHSVAVRYTEMKSASTATQAEQAEDKEEIDTYLSQLGFRPQAMSGARDIFQRDGGGDTQGAELGYLPIEPLREAPGVHDEVDQLANWYTVSQQMMGWLDNDDLSLCRN